MTLKSKNWNRFLAVFAVFLAMVLYAQTTSLGSNYSSSSTSQCQYPICYDCCQAEAEVVRQECLADPASYECYGSQSQITFCCKKVGIAYAHQCVSDHNCER